MKKIHGNFKYHNILTKKFLIKEYSKKEKSPVQIVKKVGCSQKTIYRYLKKYNIPIRDSGMKGKHHTKKSKEKISKTRKELKYEGINSGNYIDGNSLEKHFCIEPGCNNEISYNTWKYGSKKCQVCWNISKRGKKRPEHSKRMMGKNNPNFGKHKSETTKQKISKTRIRKKVAKGKNNPNYINGQGRFPYPLEFNDNLKEQIRKRDNFICQKCGITEEEHLIVYGKVLSVHHIDYDKENCDEENLITLCNECNIRINYNRDYWFAYFRYIMKNL